ncbi:hypothetical protein KAU11_08770 [Candidatus Babeliales bacterium]|nr:hypothetical protein [Candidatus Babeliales bacterium]
MGKKKLSKADYIKSYRSEMKISEKDIGAAVRNKMVKLQNLLGTINQMLDDAQIAVKNQRMIVEIVKDMACVVILRATQGRKLTAMTLEKLANGEEITYNETKTSVTIEKTILSELETDLIIAKSLHEECVSAISVLRSALSFDKAELGSFGG